MNICGDVYHVGDVVELESEDELWLGQLIALKMGPRRTRRCVVNWFYKPRDVDRGSTKGKVLAANEVFFSEHRDDNYVDCITRRVRVHLLNWCGKDHCVFSLLSQVQCISLTSVEAKPA